MRPLLVALLSLSFASLARADDPDVRTLEGEKLTFEIQTARYRSQGKKLKAFPARVAAEGFRPLSQPAPDSVASGARPVKFLDELLLIGEHARDYQQNNNQNYFLMGIIEGGGTKLVGWVPKPYVLTDTECNRKEGSQIAIKAMIVNSWEALTSQSAANYSAPRIRFAPRPDAPDDGEFRFFDFYFVWSDTDPTDERAGYALLGEVETFYAPATRSLDNYRAVSRIKGWVEKSRLCFWRTREAVQWDDLALEENPKRRRTRPAVTYATREHALFAAGLGERPGPGKKAIPVNEEPFGPDGNPVPWEGSRMRYPLLTIKTKDGNEVPYEPFEGGRVLRRIGVIGDIFDESGKRVMTQAVRKRLVDELDRARGELQRTRVLFVIDRTRSMEQWWVKTAEWTRRLIDQVKRDGREVEIGFCFYGDVHPGSDREGKATLREAVDLKGVIPGALFDIRRDKGALAARLKELEETTNPITSGYREEMVFAGLEIGLIQANWKGQENSRHARKMVILIGDDGNHILPEAEEDRTLDRIAKLLVPSTDESRRNESPIEFYALQVCQVNSDENDPTALFQKQVMKLIAKVRGRSKLAHADYFNAAADAERFFTEIDQRFAALIGAVRAIQDDLDRAERGQIERGQVGAGSQFRVPEGYRIFEDVAAGQNLSVEVALKGIQAFEERWVWDDDVESKEPQVRRMILVSKGQLDRLILILERYMTEQENPPELKDIASAIVEIQSGDSEESKKGFAAARANKGFDEFIKGQILRRQTAEDFGCVSKLIKFLGWDRKPGEPAEEIDPLEIRAFQDELLLKLYRLKDLRADRYQKYRKEPGKPIAPVGAVKTLTGPWKRGFQRFRSGTSRSSDDSKGDIWYWVDADREWP